MKEIERYIKRCTKTKNYSTEADSGSPLNCYYDFDRMAKVVQFSRTLHEIFTEGLLKIIPKEDIRGTYAQELLNISHARIEVELKRPMTEEEADEVEKLIGEVYGDFSMNYGRHCQAGDRNIKVYMFIKFSKVNARFPTWPVKHLDLLPKSLPKKIRIVSPVYKKLIKKGINNLPDTRNNKPDKTRLTGQDMYDLRKGMWLGQIPSTDKDLESDIFKHDWRDYHHPENYHDTPNRFGGHHYVDNRKFLDFSKRRVLQKKKNFRLEDL